MVFRAVSSPSTAVPTQYIRVVPEVVVEARVDVAKHEQRWQHGLRFLGLRPDLDRDDVPLDLDLER